MTEVAASARWAGPAVRDSAQAPPGQATAGLVRATGQCLALVRRAASGPAAAHVAAAVVAGVAPVASAWLLKLLLDGLTATPGRPLGTLIGLTAALGSAGVLAAAVPQITRYAQTEIDRRVTRAMRERLFTRVHGLRGLSRLEDPRFHDRLQLAEQSCRSGPRQCFAGFVGAGQAGVTLVGFLGALIAVGPRMAAVVLVAAVPALHVEALLTRQRAATTWRLGQPERREIFYSRLLSSIEAAKEVRLFGLGRFLVDRMLSELDGIQRERRRVDRRELVAQGLLAVVAAVVAGGGLLWAIHQARAGELTVGDVSVFVAAVVGVQGALSGIVTQVGTVHEAALLSAHYVTIVDEPPDLPPARPALSAARPRDVPPLRRGIELRDVWFRYGDDQPWILRGVDLDLPRGGTTAVVGVNGAGKSTLVKLLCRFYDPTRGSIRWDGIDLRELDVDRLRARIGAVFQDFMHYDLTCRENIAVGDLRALGDHPRVEAAARRAGSHDFVTRLPNGYDTALTRIFFGLDDKADPTTGTMLSGGQWQRLALARALVRDRCDLLVLDEPSAGLDVEAEYEVHQRLREHRAGRASLLISHRLSTVRDADEIVVLSGGRVAERGSHRELLDMDGIYRRLFAVQASGYLTDQEV